jgi:hypothetical protein
VATRREPHKPPPEQQKPTSKPERKHWLEYAIFGFVVLTAVGTGFAAYYTRQQYLVADDTERQQLRSYVGIIPGDIENFGDRALQQFTMTRKNYGQTPAYDLAVVAWGQSVNPSNQQVPIMEIAPPPDIRGAITLFPGGELPFRFGGIMVPQDLFASVLTRDDVFLPITALSNIGMCLTSGTSLTFVGFSPATSCPGKMPKDAVLTTIPTSNAAPACRRTVCQRFTRPVKSRIIA